MDHTNQNVVGQNYVRNDAGELALTEKVMLKAWVDCYARPEWLTSYDIMKQQLLKVIVNICKYYTGQPTITKHVNRCDSINKIMC